MRLWWGGKWEPILVFQINFHEIFEYLKKCYKQLDVTVEVEKKWRASFSDRDFERLENIETGLTNYIRVIETREDYMTEIGDTGEWRRKHKIQTTGGDNTKIGIETNEVGVELQKLKVGFEELKRDVIFDEPVHDDRTLVAQSRPR